MRILPHTSCAKVARTYMGRPWSPTMLSGVSGNCACLVSSVTFPSSIIIAISF
jgi:hypothetical protein